MKIKLIACSILAALISSTAFAGNVYIGPSAFLQYVSGSHTNYTGIHPQLSLGYGDLSNNIYLAGEIFAAAGNLTINDSHNRASRSAKITRTFGASFIPGMMLNEKVLGFLRLGIVNSKFNGPNTTKTGGQIGVGLQTSLNPCWDIRGEYDFSAYRSMSGIGSPKVNEIGVGVIYKIDA